MEWETEPNIRAVPQGRDFFLAMRSPGYAVGADGLRGACCLVGSYKAWGEARQAISEAGRRAGFRNPIRFQGQYWDDETGLHYNRYRYYDPYVGRFVRASAVKRMS